MFCAQNDVPATANRVVPCTQQTPKPLDSPCVHRMVVPGLGIEWDGTNYPWTFTYSSRRLQREQADVDHSRPLLVLTLAAPLGFSTLGQEDIRTRRPHFDPTVRP